MVATKQKTKKTAPEKMLLSLEKVSLTLGSKSNPVKILKDVCLNIKTGETISIVGPSGSGKTSLLMLLGGLEPVTSGNIKILDQDLSLLNEDSLASFRRENISIIFQNFHLMPTMTALENVALPLELAHDKNALKKAKNALKDVGLQDRVSHFPAQLSGGEQQRVAIARAFISKPTLLLADEPTGNLDDKTSQKIMSVLFSQKEKYNTTLILVTHDKALAKQCSKTLHMTDGRLK